MAIKRLQRSPSDGVNACDILGYLKEHPDIQELACEEVVNDEDVQAMDQLLWDCHSAIHLTALELPNNGLTSQTGHSLHRILNTQCGSLLRLDVSHNPLTSTAIIELLQPVLENSTVLRYLNLSGTQMGPKGASIIASLLQHNTTVQELYIAKNNLGTKGIKLLAPCIASNETLQILDVSHNRLASGGATVLAKEMQKSQLWTLTRLNISSNKIRSKGMNAFGELLVLDRRLTSFFVSSNELKAQGAAFLAGVLKHNYTLQDIRLDDNELGDVGASLVIDELASNSTLRSLDLSWNQLGTGSVVALAEALPQNNALEKLILAGNQLGCEGTIAISRALEFNLCLKEIDLNTNQIQNPGAFALTMTLSKPTSNIERIHWSENPIPDEGVASLKRIPRIKLNYKCWLGDLLKDISKKDIVNLKLNLTEKVVGDEEVLLLTNALKKKDKLTIHSFYLEGASISARSLVPFSSKVLASPSAARIERLYIRNTVLGDAGTAAIAKALQTNTSLKILLLSKCRISCEGARALAEGLRSNYTLQRLNLNRNSIGDEGFSSLWSTLQGSSVTTLSVGFNGLTDQIFDSPNLSLLSELHLNGNAISDLGALKLCAQSPNTDLQQLSLLSMRNTQVTERGANTLQNWFGGKAFIDY